MPVAVTTRSKSGEGVTIVLGAGASRGVSYAHEHDIPSPLDYDFFDLLQRLTPRKSDTDARQYVLDAIRGLPQDYRRSMEKAFYTLQLRAYLSEKLGDCRADDETVIRNFARCIQALLRSAHGMERCEFHQDLLGQLHGQDTIISFNYDLVPERALSQTATKKHAVFGPWLYGLESPPTAWDLPMILKLHGSSNWMVHGENEFQGIRTRSWKALDAAPGYLGFKGAGTVFPIFLPFWDKRIEEGFWLNLWKTAYQRLHKTKTLIVWGYSLPVTDVKAHQLFSLGLKRVQRMCVIDLSHQTRERWRAVAPDALYWEYDTMPGFREHPPKWWTVK